VELAVTTDDLMGRPADSEEVPAASVRAYPANCTSPSASRRQLRLVPAETAASAAAEPTVPEQTDPCSGSVPLVARKNIAFNVSVLAGSQVVTWSLTLVWTVIVPRLLGPSGMGELVTATSVASILGVVLGLGTKPYLVREIVVAPDRAPKLIGSSIVLRICLVPVFAAAVIVYSRLAHYGNGEAWVLYLATGATVLMLLTEPMQAAFQAFERMQYLAYSNVVMSTLQIALGVSLALIGFRAVGLTASMVFVMAAVLLLNALWARRHVRIDLRTNVHAMRSLVTDSLAYWSFAVFYMIYLWIDTVILSLMTDSKVVGWYGVSTRLFTTLMFVPAILSTAWLPRLVAAFEEAPRRLHETARRPIEIVLLLGLPICVLAALTAAPVIRILFGPGYAGAAPVLAVLALVVPLMYLNIMLNQVVIAAKRQSIWTWIMAGATVVNPLFNIALVPLFQSHFGNGAIGAAVALWLTELLIVVVGIAVVGRRVLEARSLWRLGRGLLAALAMAGVMYLLRPLGFVAAAAGGGLVFMGAAVALRVPSAEEWAWARQGVSNAGRTLARRNPLRRRSP
jgi:O-antigen/teichoic acid export membrane protein